MTRATLRFCERIGSKMSGERKENSVLFTLKELKDITSDDAAAATAEAPRPAKRSSFIDEADDLLADIRNSVSEDAAAEEARLKAEREAREAAELHARDAARREAQAAAEARLAAEDARRRAAADAKAAEEAKSAAAKARA
ncbi:MAG: hypothetical protein KC613_15775, partial [Myxococcales bacterium]|nr:hypothetical protein [Myxococcales bacterium]